MTQIDENRLILVVSSTPELVESTRKATERAAARVDFAVSRTEGLNKIREYHPDIVILGVLEHEESVHEFYQQLKEGWISHHASLLVVETIGSNDLQWQPSEESDSRILCLGMTKER